MLNVNRVGLRRAVDQSHAISLAKGGSVSLALADALAEEPEQAEAIHYRMNADRSMRQMANEVRKWPLR